MVILHVDNIIVMVVSRQNPKSTEHLNKLYMHNIIWCLSISNSCGNGVESTANACWNTCDIVFLVHQHSKFGYYDSQYSYRYSVHQLHRCDDF